VYEQLAKVKSTRANFSKPMISLHSGLHKFVLFTSYIQLIMKGNPQRASFTALLVCDMGDINGSRLGNPKNLVLVWAL
jgi:hypothetical protein